MSDQDRKGGGTATFLKLSMATLLTLGGLNAIQNRNDSSSVESGHGAAVATTSPPTSAPKPTAVPKPTQIPPTPAPKETAIPTRSPDQMETDLARLEALLPSGMESLHGVKNIEVTLGNGKKAEMPVNFKGEKIKVIYDDGTVEWVTGLPFRDPETDDTYYLTERHGQTPLTWVNNPDNQTGYFGIASIEDHGLPKAPDDFVNPPIMSGNDLTPWAVGVGIVGGVLGLAAVRRNQGRRRCERATLGELLDNTAGVKQGKRINYPWSATRSAVRGELGKGVGADPNVVEEVRTRRNNFLEKTDRRFWNVRHPKYKDE